MLKNYLNLLRKTKKIKLLLTDIDGVWTNGHIYYGDDGNDIRQFHVHDGLGIKRLMEAGIEIAVVSSYFSKAVQRRCQQLGIKDIFLGVKDKEEVLERLMKEKGYSKDELAYMGDDLPDAKLFKKVCVAITVFNAPEAVKEKAHYVTTKMGGEGALREISDLILEAKENG
jgi:3-deoxy-D-manno-octulosonate 8-phosphate phosphatase (KDO 8-P phosphatase)